MEEDDIIDISSPDLIIHGDNGIVLPKLLSFYCGQIDLVYIDPPYNTSGSFYYSTEHCAHISHQNNAVIAYKDKLYLKEYLKYMRVILSLVHKLLSPHGSLYLHIDTRTGPYLRIILDEIFGIENFINEITRVKSNPKNFQRNAYGNIKDIIYFYSKVPHKNIFNNITIPLTPSDKERLFPKQDERGRRYATVPCHAPGETRNGSTGAPWRGIMPPPGRHWRCSPDELEHMEREGLIEWSANGVPRIRKFADEHHGCKIQDIWPNFKDPQYPSYPTEKNMEMLELIVEQSSNKESIVLDCFCGSGSFLSAAARKERRAIGIDQSDVAIEVARGRPALENFKFVKI